MRMLGPPAPVWAGDVIGRVGGTGGVVPHLHYEQLADGIGVAVRFKGQTIPVGTTYRSGSDPTVRSHNCALGHPRVMHHGAWVLTNSLQPHLDTGNRIRFSYGNGSYIPVVGDWDGDGDDTAGVFQPSTGNGALTNSLQTHIDTGNRIRSRYGDSSYVPLAGNWDGHGGTTRALPANQLDPQGGGHHS